VTIGAIAVDGGDLPLGGGLLALLRPALSALPPGGVVVVRSTCPELGRELVSWCRVERHDWLGTEELGPGCAQHMVRRGTLGVPREFPMPADNHSGFAPRGARVEPGGPAYPFSIVDGARVAPPEVAALYQQAVAAQWDPNRDIPWGEVGRHAPELERAVAQIMTFLAENELSALYVPSQFIARIHPAYVEVGMFLATQLHDEARHTDVFLRRARACGEALGISSVTTSRSLLSLLELQDFTEAAFLLSVLGEGTFLDLLRFVEVHAPDDATREIARRTRVDETRHVHFGLSHVRHALGHDPTLYPRLGAAVRKRAATLHNAGGVPAPLQDALTVLAGRGIDPAGISRGHDAFRQLLVDMDDHRVRRLTSAGFTAEQAHVLSELHTSNFM
jgi:TusA-related sulfurtransferase